MSVIPKNKGTSHQIKSSDPNCHEWISVAAYYKAEARGFESRKELDDWLEAEVDYTKFQIKLFFLRCEEDGGMTLAELQGLGRYIGIDHPEHINTEVELIRKIQNIALVFNLNLKKIVKKQNASGEQNVKN